MSKKKSKSGGKKAAAAPKKAAAKQYPFPTVRVRGVRCHATTLLPADDELERIQAKEAEREKAAKAS